MEKPPRRHESTAAGSESAEAGYDGLGRQIYASRNGDEIHYVYNGFGELTGEVSLSGTKKYTYDEAGLLTKKEISSKLGIEALTEYEYDKMNRPVSVKTAVGTETVSYDKAGRITEKALGATGERVTYSYNADGTVKQSIRTKQGNIVYSERYEYDKNGNRVFSEENGKIRDYWYDENNRLKKIRIGGEGGDYEIYEFDGFGNISTKVEIDGNYIDKTQYSYDNRNRLISSTDGEESTAYEYDKNGNLKKKVDFYGIHSKTETYTYTAFGELKTAEGDNFFAEYRYGADGFRSGKKVNGVSTGYVYDGMYIVGESVDGVNYTYSRGTDLLGYTSSLGETVYYRTNVHGDVKELVNVFGESLERYDYNAYGAEDEDYNPFRRMFGKKSVYNPFRYTGEYTDSETGLVYLRNRMYDPETGRFTTEDPAKSGVNWYAYCEGNPIMFIDPSGLRNVVAIAGSDKNSDDNVFLDDINTFIEDNPDDVVVVIKAWEYDDWSKIKDAMKDAFGKEGIDVLIIAAHASTSSITLSNDWQRPGRPNIYIDKNTKWNSIKFNKGANIKILGCNAGGMAGQKNMVTEVNEDSDGNFESYTGALIKFKSIAQIIANKTNTTVWAYTNYTSQKQIGHGYYQTPVNMYGEGEMNFKYMTGMWWWKKEQEMAGTVNNAFTKFERQ